MIGTRVFGNVTQFLLNPMQNGQQGTGFAFNSLTILEMMTDDIGEKSYFGKV
jgi:hypothetical protein